MNKNVLIFSFLIIVFINPANAEKISFKSVYSLHKNLRLDIGGGQSLLMASTSSAVDYLSGLGVEKSAANTYYDNLKKGLVFDTRLHYMYTEKYGYGIIYQLNKSNSKVPGLVEISDNSYNYIGEINETIYTNYVGLSFLMTEPIIRSARLTYKLEYSLGAVFYQNQSQFIISKSEITGTAFAANISIGLQYELTKKLSIGIRANTFASTLKKITINYKPDEVGTSTDTKETLTRINWLAYLSFNL
ncbi:MAG: hypothetical protein ACOYMD_05975 [Paludibacter sp.]